jgi:transposase
MEYYAGLDVSLKAISICMVDADGKTVVRGVSPVDPAGGSGL